MEKVKEHFKNWWWAYLLVIIGLLFLVYHFGGLRFGKLTIGKR